MECSIPLTPSWRPLQFALAAALMAACVFWWRGFPVVACLLVAAAAIDTAWHVHRCRRLPAALFLQGSRWWCITSDGELEGPWRLNGKSRRGTWWVALELGDGRRRRRLWLQRDMLSREGWSRLHWEVLSQASRWQRAGRTREDTVWRRLRASARNHLLRRRPRGNQG